MQGHLVPRRTYFAIWAALMLLTALTAWLSFYDLGRWSLLVAMLIAGTKATLVGLFFMHIKYSDPVERVAALVGIFWLLVMFALTGSDYLTRHLLTGPNP